MGAEVLTKTLVTMAAAPFQQPQGGSNRPNAPYQNSGNRRSDRNEHGDGRKPKREYQRMDIDQVIAETDSEMGNDVHKLRLLIPASKSGRIIGKGGANAKVLKEKYSCKMTIPDNSSPERVLTIEGTLLNTLGFLYDILDKVQKDASTEEQTTFEIRYIVHKSQAGAIIGSEGQRIKQLREDLDCQVRCFPDPAPMSTDRIVRICGEKDNVIKGCKIFYNFCKKSPPKGPNSPYDPQNCQPMMASQYGGLQDKETPSVPYSQPRGQIQPQPAYHPAPPQYGQPPHSQYQMPPAAAPHHPYGAPMQHQPYQQGPPPMQMGAPQHHYQQGPPPTASYQPNYPPQSNYQQHSSVQQVPPTRTSIDRPWGSNELNTSATSFTPSANSSFAQQSFNSSYTGAPASEPVPHANHYGGGVAPRQNVPAPYGAPQVPSYSPVQQNGGAGAYYGRTAPSSIVKPGGVQQPQTVAKAKSNMKW